ncbi:MAG: CpXC domain-containing protein [Bacteroidales bacterium]|nr:CpXC domain-containing protein [Bacteroidales bacterium]
MTAVCTHCGSSFEAQVYQSINTALDPSLKARVRDGSLFVHECPYCGTRNLLKYQTLYHDPSARLMIWLLPGDEMPPKEAEEAVRQLDGYTLRLVREAGELIEKVNIFASGLEDTVMEMCKWVTRRELAAKTPSAADAPLKFVRTQGADNDIVMAFPLNGQMNVINVGFNVYEDAKAILSRNPSVVADSGFAQIDSIWLERFFR